MNYLLFGIIDRDLDAARQAVEADRDAARRGGRAARPRRARVEAPLHAPVHRLRRRLTGSCSPHGPDRAAAPSRARVARPPGVVASPHVHRRRPCLERALPRGRLRPVRGRHGENSLQRFISEHLRPLVEDYLRELRGPTFVGADQYVGWDPDDPEKVLAPDVYVLPGVAPGEDFEFWKVWQTGIVPSFALEIVSKRKKKDYTDVPPLYGELGVDELIIFDPRFKRRRAGLRFQVYRSVARRGFVRVEATNDDRVRSRVLGCWIRVVGDGGASASASPRAPPATRSCPPRGRGPPGPGSPRGSPRGAGRPFATCARCSASTSRRSARRRSARWGGRAWRRCAST